MKPEELTRKVIGCAHEVHRALGPGLLESTYRECLARELCINHIAFVHEHPFPIQYKGVRLNCGYKVDFLIEDRIVVELKAVTQLLKLHEAQLLTYMKLSGIGTGLLINFNVIVLKNGIRQLVMA
jgi:GxxExxY protein